MTLVFHPVASIFPMMNATEFDALKADIAASEQREPIWLHPDGSILDGRNRYLACCDLGLKPVTRTYVGPLDTPSLVQFVVSLNLKRRHLDSGQRAFIALEIERVLADAAKEQQGQRTDLFQRIEKGYEPPKPIHAAEQAAAIMGTNRQYVADAKRITEQAPDLAQAVKNGDKTITEAKRTLKERKRETVRQQNRSLVEDTPPVITVATNARYQTIVIDPPWDWGDEGDVDQYGRARPVYATMPLEEIAALPVSDLACDNAHIYLWITNRSLPKGFGLLDRWGFRHITVLTWVKPSFGMGNYFRGSTEHVLFGVRGSLPLLRHDAPTHFTGNRPGLHSGKPDEFYSIVETCSPGPWLEMFSRKPRNGWIAWGAEA